MATDGAARDATPGAVTLLLREWGGGDERALERLMPLVYAELRRIAQSHLRRERPDHTLQRTALVHEVFIKLVGQKSVAWQSEEHFLSLASRLMRRILVDHARAKQAAKRGDGVADLSLDEAIAALEGDGALSSEGMLPVGEDRKVDVIAIDAALDRLQRMDAQQARIVELRFFGGLTIDEAAQVVGVSVATVKREWATARAWLHRELGST